LELFTYEVKEGTTKNFNDNINNIALTEQQANKYFGHTSAIGKEIRIDSLTYSVSVILANNPTNSSFQFDILLPLSTYLSDEINLESDQTWGVFAYHTFLKLPISVEPTQIENKLIASAAKYSTNKKEKFVLEEIKEMRYSSAISFDLTKRNKKTVYIFSLIGFLLLLTACMNYIGLSTALINKRSKEIGIKKIIGASFQHIFFQVLMETVLLSLIAFMVALSIAQLSMPYLANLLALPLVLNFEQLPIWGVLGGVLLLSLLLSGIYPALLFSSFKPLRLLQKVNTKKNSISLRQVLVVGQFTMAIILLVSTFIIQEQLQFILQKDVGYDRSQIVEIRPNMDMGDWDENLQQLKVLEKSLRQIPEFEAITTTSSTPVHIESNHMGTFKWKGKDPKFREALAPLSADENLQAVFDLTLKKGRWFLPENALDKNNVILNETAVQEFKIPTPIIGQPIEHLGKKGTIIGVVADFQYGSLRNYMRPLLIHYNDGWENMLVAKIHGKNIAAALSKAEQQFKIAFPQLPFQYTFADDTYQQLHESETKMSWLFQLFAGILLFIACLGLFGLSTFSVERRSKEIGIRKVLGASVANIVGLLSTDFLKLVGFALLLGIPIAWYFANGWLDNFAYRMTIQPWVFVVAGLATIGLAFLTVGLQSVRAAISNPVESLRNE